MFFTSESDWDPTTLDNDIDDDSDVWFDSISDIEPDPNMARFDEVGNYRFRVTIQHADYFHRNSTDNVEDVIDRCIHHSQTFNKSPTFYDAYETELNDTIDDNFEPNQFQMKLNP